MSKTKKKSSAEHTLELERAKALLEQASAEKRRVILMMTLLACATPLLLGVRLWADIPPSVPGGIAGSDGESLLLPGWVVAFGMPVLLCVLNAGAQATLRFNQGNLFALRQIVGRWSFSLLSVLLCSGSILESAGETPSPSFLVACALGLGLMMLGAHMWDCPRDARVALRFAFTQSDSAWKAVHRFAAWVWMTAGLAVIAGTMLAVSPTLTAGIFLAALLAPMAYGLTRTNKLN